MADVLTGLGLGGFIIAVTFLATVDWIHPGPHTAPERTRP
jgi:uncharacterized membrane protein